MSHFTVLVIGADIAKQLAPFQENNMGDCPREYLAFNEDQDGKPDPATGKRGYWENPQAKWDWYLLGGRWTGAFPLKPGSNGKVGKPGVMTPPGSVGFVDQCRIGDVDWAALRVHMEEKHSRLWSEYQERLRQGDSSAVWIYGVKEGDTRDSYIERGLNFCTYAVVLKGKWYEHGKMGWWAAATDEKPDDVWQAEFKKLLSDLPPETLISLVDCHI